MDWNYVNKYKGKLPKQGKSVLVILEESFAMPRCITTAYCKKYDSEVVWITIGMGRDKREVIAWCDCLDQQLIRKAYLT